MRSKPFISVVVPTCDRNEMLAECLKLLSPGAQTLSSDRYEVIVTDDSQEMNAFGMISEHFPWVRWVQGPGHGPAANRNNGAMVARGAWLVFVDDDCFPDSNLLEVYAAAMDTGARALEGTIHPMGNADRDLADCPVNTTGGYFWSANIAIERELFAQVGGFDPNYPMAAHEDQDLHLRLLEKTPVTFLPGAKVHHPVRMLTLWTALKRIPSKAQAWAIHASKHRQLPGHATDRGILLGGIWMHLRIAAKSALKGKWKSCLYHVAWATAGTYFTGQALEKGAVRNG